MGLLALSIDFKISVLACVQMGFPKTSTWSSRALTRLKPSPSVGIADRTEGRSRDNEWTTDLLAACMQKWRGSALLCRARGKIRKTNGNVPEAVLSDSILLSVNLRLRLTRAASSPKQTMELDPVSYKSLGTYITEQLSIKTHNNHLLLAKWSLSEV